MMIMDQVRDRFEMETVVNETMQDIGEYTESDRVYLFDKTENGTYRSIAEWHRNNMLLRADCSGLQRASISLFMIWSRKRT